MAEKIELGGKFQIVFLVDVYVKEDHSCGKSLENIFKLKSQAISLCALRLLLHFNSVIDSGNFTPLKWGFKFYNSNTLNFEYKRRRFLELNSESFERFEDEMRERFTYIQKNLAKGDRIARVKSLSFCLTEILHDFPWLTPNVSSPYRDGKNDLLNMETNQPRNYLFVISDCPVSDVDMCQFLGRNTMFLDAEILFKEMFSTALFEEFHTKCKLSLFWIDSAWGCCIIKPNSFKDWKGYCLMSSVMKRLGGNIIPISSLVQERPLFCKPLFESCASNSKGLKRLAEAQVLKATFKFTVGKIIQAFLSGIEFINEDIVDNAQEFPNTIGLLKGTMCFQDKKVCSVVVSHIFRNKLASTSNVKQDNDANINMAKAVTVTCDTPSVVSGQKPEKFLGSDAEMTNRLSNTLLNGNMAETRGKQHVENCFVIKGVISSSDVSPSWMHPTKLYSCINGETCNEIGNASSVQQTRNLVFGQMLSLLSSKSLSMVIEYQDPESGALVTGLLQPMSLLCAILTTISKEKLLLVEKALLHYRSCGPVLVPCCMPSNEAPCGMPSNEAPCGMPSNEADVNMLPFRLCKFRDDHFEGIGTCKLSQQGKNETNKFCIDSYISIFQKKKSRKEPRVKLKNLCSNIKSETNDGKEIVQAPLARGKLCQETASEKIKASISLDTELQNNVLDSEVETEDSTATQTNLESELTDETDEALPDLSMIQNVDDLKANLEEGYKRCLDQEQSGRVYAIRAFQMVEHFKRSGQLKDIVSLEDIRLVVHNSTEDLLTEVSLSEKTDEVDAFLRSSILRDSKHLVQVSNAEEKESHKKRIVLEYQLQVFLRLEFSYKIGIIDEEKVADEIVSILRGLLFQKDPAYISLFLKNNVVPRYAGNLSGLLRQVYDGLMQRPPKEILSPSQMTSEEETPLKSRKTLSSSKKVRSAEEAHFESSQTSRTLVRRHSVLGIPAKRREIVIPVKGKSDKTRKKAGSAGTRSGKKHSSKMKKPVTPVKKVRRNLFEEGGNKSSPKKDSKAGFSKSQGRSLNRRHSVAAISKSKEVLETPIAKQVSQRMLHRQERARRRSKAVIDVTVIAESPEKDDGVLPRKSPRRKASTFYSSQRAVSSKKTASKNFSMSAECAVEDRLPTPRSNYTKVLNISSSSKPDDYDSFADVFLDAGDKNERDILSTCSSHQQEGITCDKSTVSQSSGDNCCSGQVLPCTLKVRNQATDCSLASTLTTVNTTRSVSRRCNSSPSISTTPPLKQSKSPLVLHKSFPTTSPILFKTPKSSPIHFSPDQIFDISIPLTPVKLKDVIPLTSELEKNSKIRTRPFSNAKNGMTSPSEIVVAESGAIGDTETLRNELRQHVGTKSASALESVGNDTESVVASSPQLSRKRCLISRRKLSTSLNFENGAVDSYMTRNNVAINEGELTTVSCPEVRGHRVGLDVGALESLSQKKTELFKSPVTTKRKTIRSEREGKISPMNQILKQRKNKRKTPPVTPRGALCKQEKIGNSNSSKEESRGKHISLRKKRKINLEEVYSLEAGKTLLDNSPVHDDYMSPEGAHFKPKSLSANALKHLQESPVLHSSCPQSTDSRTRKWSDRKSPLSTCKRSFRKRLRHDS